MITNTEIEKLKNEIDSFEHTINKINLIILVTKNNNLINIYKTNIITKNNVVVRKVLIDYIKSIELLKDCKIQYILKFIINKSLEELNSTINIYEDCYKITPLTSLNNITFSESLNNSYKNNTNTNFATINSLIIIAKMK